MLSSCFGRILTLGILLSICLRAVTVSAATLNERVGHARASGSEPVEVTQLLAAADGAAAGNPAQQGAEEIDPRVRDWQRRLQEPAQPGSRRFRDIREDDKTGRRSGTPMRARMIEADPKPSPADDDVVAIRFSSYGRSKICSGEALSSKAILTAGHCTCGDPETYEVIIGPTAGANVHASKRLAVSDIERFPGYICGQPPEAQPGLDLGLIKLARHSEYLQDKVRPIAMFGEAYRDRPEYLEVYGYGFTETGAIGERRGAGVPIVSFTCTEAEWRRHNCSQLREFVLSVQFAPNSAGKYPRNRDSCGGDSGGPVFWYSKDRFAYLVGIVSRGLAVPTTVAGQPCGGGGIYSIVGRYSVISWLESEGVEVCFRQKRCSASQ